MSRVRSAPFRGFTLVEMLVVLGIIAILIALLTPAVMFAVNRGRITRMGIETANFGKAIEKYKEAKGDYPPNFRDYNAFIRHVQRCYPNVNPAHLNAFIGVVWPTFSVTNPPPVGTVPLIDEGESLVFWLGLTKDDPRLPFTFAGAGNANAPYKEFYDFDDRLLADDDGDLYPSTRAIYAKDTFYLYVDSRSYDELLAVSGGAFLYSGAHAESVTANAARPYYSSTGSGLMNATSYQVLCAGQDGEFGADPSPAAPKYFPGGANFLTADKDNIANFSSGKIFNDFVE